MQIEFFEPRVIKESDSSLFAAFDCGEPSLNSWLQNKCLGNGKRNASKTYVVISSDGCLAAFYCLSAHTINHSFLKASLKRNMSDPIPVLLLGRLAVDLKYQKLGLGKALVQYALQISKQVAQTIGVVGLYTYPLSEKAVNFYENRGFMQIKDDFPGMIFKL